MNAPRGSALRIVAERLPHGTHCAEAALAEISRSADCIDAEFFGLSRREAEITDPQQRVFLECAWEALEHAGYTGDCESVGVFAGAGMNTYFLQLLSNPSVIANAGGYQLMLANDKDFLATRVAYKFTWRARASSQVIAIWRLPEVSPSRFRKAWDISTCPE